MVIEYKESEWGRESSWRRREDAKGCEKRERNRVTLSGWSTDRLRKTKGEGKI